MYSIINDQTDKAYMALRVDDNAAVEALLADKGYQPDLGARPVKRAVQKYVIDKLSIFMIEGSTQEACKVEMFLANDELQFRFI